MGSRGSLADRPLGCEIALGQEGLAVRVCSITLGYGPVFGGPKTADPNHEKTARFQAVNNGATRWAVMLGYGVDGQIVNMVKLHESDITNRHASQIGGAFRFGVG